MNPKAIEPRLSQIPTLWTLFRQAHDGPAEAATAARNRLVERYSGAAHRYLLGALRDADAAAELRQKFCLRFLAGELRRADPAQGRFRDYVKTVLRNLVNDYRREQKSKPGPLPSDWPAPPGPGAESDIEQDWSECLRQELVTRARNALAAKKPIEHALLLSLEQQPDLPPSRLAAELSARFNKPFSAGNLRQIKYRARARLANLIVKEVMHSLEEPTEAELAEELHALGLFSYCTAYCAPVLERRASKG
jgi:DNA-directed RNA polymerase specialized sigma24 family protein